MKITMLASLCMLSTASVSLTAFAEPTTETESKIDYAAVVEMHVRPAIDAELIPGAVVAIHADGQTHFYPIGTLNYDMDRSPTVQTLYEIGSISKVLTGVLFADAVRRDEVARDTPVNDLLPEGYSAQAKDGQGVLLWHLTTHTSGWATAPINLAPIDGERPFLGFTREMMFKAINAMPPKTKPGETFEYSNLAVGLLGTLIADNAGSGYEQLVKDRVLSPLGIEDFTITLSDEQQARLAPATTSGRATKPWGTMGPMDPAGMWITTAPGLMEFALANLEDQDDDIHESLALAREVLLENSGFGSVCSGWMLARDGTTYWHNGMTGGYSSYMGVNRAAGTAVVVLTNGATIQTTAIGEKLMQAVFGLNPDPISPTTIKRLDPKDSARLVGVYHSSLGADMTVSESRGRLFAQITGQQPLDLAPVEGKDHRFRFTLVEAELEFEVPEEGNAPSVTLFQNGMEIRWDRKED